MRFGPPKFYGEPNDLKAELWISEVDQIFRAIQSEDPERVEFAVFLLKGPARDWWKLVEQRWINTRTPYTWDGFLFEFREKYIPQVMRDRREKEFMDLEQGGASVGEYEA